MSQYVYKKKNNLVLITWQQVVIFQVFEDLPFY